ncbi:MAG: DUF2807 domain-containing protein [Bacteroidetes bacterium]|nr:DUF2807 domain-containing protein [Bacteroidota bacterium]GIK69670.1 MAG: lipoprotein [Bacteroidota bacterium]
MEKIMRTYILACVCVFLLNCKKPEDRTCFKPAGEITKLKISLSAFDYIEVKDYVDVFLTPDTIEFAEVEGGKNLITHITIKQEENKLFIRNQNKCDWVRKYTQPIKIYLHYKTLNTIEYQSSGNIYFTDTLAAPKFTINQRGGSGICYLVLKTDSCFLNIHTGPGDFVAEGKTINCLVFCNGNGFIDASKLVSDYSFVNSKGTGDTKIYTTLHLDAIISYIGNIYYFGNPPKVNKEIKGKGQVIKVN